MKTTKKKNEKVTNEQLAVMMQKGFLSVDKKFTRANEQLAVMMQKGFSGVEEKITEAIEELAVMVQKEFLDIDKKFDEVDERFTMIDRKSDMRFNTIDGELKGIRNSLTHKADAVKVEALEYRMGKVESAVGIEPEK